MAILVWIVALALAADGALLLADPALYRRCLGFVDELLGPVWVPAYGLSLAALGLFVIGLAWAAETPASVGIVGVLVTVVGLLIAVRRTERFAVLGKWWLDRPTWFYRLAGLGLVMLAGLVWRAKLAL